MRGLDAESYAEAESGKTIKAHQPNETRFHYSITPATTLPTRKASAPEEWSPTPRPIPIFYMLEKSHVHIDTRGEPVVVLATRLSYSIRCLKLFAEFDNENATASITAPDHVEMSLFLWKAPPKYSDGGVIVELQRRRGCCLAFHTYARAILDAATGNIEPSLCGEFSDGEAGYSAVKNYNEMLAEIGVEILGTRSWDTRKIELGRLRLQTNPPEIDSVLEFAVDMLLRTNSCETRELGLECLNMLTKPSPGSLNSLSERRMDDDAPRRSPKKPPLHDADSQVLAMKRQERPPGRGKNARGKQPRRGIRQFHRTKSRMGSHRSR